MKDLPSYLYAQACNNAWSNLRLLRACAALPQDEFAALRTSFFPSLQETLNHNLAVDHYYVDAIERALHGEPPNAHVNAFFDPAAQHAACAPLWDAQRAVDRRLMQLCRGLAAESIVCVVRVPRDKGLQNEALVPLLGHLFEHQIHHRGQAHAMLAGTAIAPPQLDEFFCVADARTHRADLVELGVDTEYLWGPL